MNETPQVPSVRLPAVRLSGLGDERLARLVGSGRERAFTAIYERYHQQLYRYCRSLLHDDHDAQDALQSTFAAALAALRKGQRTAPLRPWLFRIAHNEAISLLRRTRPDSELSEAVMSTTASAEEQAGQNASLATLVSDLQALPERQRSALLMRELSGLSHEEIAVALGTSIGGAKQAIFEARGGLAELSEGRAMPCEDVRRAISDGDRRSLRARRVRAHMRDCAACTAFAAAIPTRRQDLKALVPALPPAASAALLARIAGGSGHGSVSGGGLGGATATSAAGGNGLGATTVGAMSKIGGMALVSKAAVGAAVVVSAAGVGVATKELLHNAAPAAVQTGHASSSRAGAGSATGSRAGTVHGAGSKAVAIAPGAQGVSRLSAAGQRALQTHGQAVSATSAATVMKAGKTTAGGRGAGGNGAGGSSPSAHGHGPPTWSNGNGPPSSPGQGNGYGHTKSGTGAGPHGNGNGGLHGKPSSNGNPGSSGNTGTHGHVGTPSHGTGNGGVHGNGVGNGGVHGNGNGPTKPSGTTTSDNNGNPSHGTGKPAISGLANGKAHK